MEKLFSIPPVIIDAKKSKENGSITLYANIPPNMKHANAVKIKGNSIFLSFTITQYSKSVPTEVCFPPQYNFNS